MTNGERDFGEMQGKLDALIRAVEEARRERRQWERDLDERFFGRDGVLVRQSARIGELERWRARIKGAQWTLAVLWAVLVAAVGWIASSFGGPGK